MLLLTFAIALAALILSLAAVAALGWLAVQVGRLAELAVGETITAADAAAETIHAENSAPATVDADRRTIDGLIVPYGVPGDTSAGPVIVDRGALQLPDDPSRIKLLLGHDRERPVGYLVAHREDERGLWGTFAVASGPDGDAALAAVRDRTRDGLSFEVSRARYSPDRARLTAARLDAVALCAVPAYDDARALAASRQGDDMLTLETARAALAASDSSAQDRAAAAAYLLAHPEATDADRTAAEAVTRPTNGSNDGDAADNADNADAADAGNDAASSAVSVAAGRAPAGITAGRAGARVTAQQAIHRLSTALRGAADAGQVNAALADVVPANDAGLGFMGQGQWVGEFWTAQAIRRDFIESFQRATLTSGTKVHGWRWVNKPEVGPWSGNKTEVPTNPVATEPAEAPISRTAGGWDIDRIFFDLGDASFLTSFLAAATQDYAVKTEAEFAEDILAAATSAPASTSLTGALVLLARTLTMRGARLSTVGMAADVFAEYLEMPANEAPWWLARQGNVDLADGSTSAGGVDVTVIPSLPAGTVIAADRRAATYYEASPAPIRVQAVNVPLGGIDLGVYGYHATLVHDPTAIVTTTVTAGA